MNRCRFLLALMLLLGSSAKALIPVTDLAHIAETAAMAANVFAQLIEQRKKIQQDFEYMKNQLRKLKELGWKDSYKLKEHMALFDSFKSRVKSITYDYENLDREFFKTYGSDAPDFRNKHKAWDRNTEDAIRSSLKSHGYLKDSKRKLIKISDLVTKQRSAQGQMQVLQTLVELNAIQARQMEELKQIIALDSRSKQLRVMEERSQGKAAQQRGKNLLRDFDKHRPSKPMSRLPRLGEGVGR